MTKAWHEKNLLNACRKWRKVNQPPASNKHPPLRSKNLMSTQDIYLNKYGIQYQMTISLPWNPQHIGLVVSRFDLTLLNVMLF